MAAPVENPFALLTALRRNAARVSLYSHAGATKVPARYVPLLTFLEDAVHPVTPPRRDGVFHPKFWVLRFVPKDVDDTVRYRLVVLSRNLTFDRSWDVALTLDGELTERKRGFAENRPLGEFIAALPSMARAAGHDLPVAAVERADLLADEVRRVDWSLPEGFDTLAFHPAGHDGRPSWPIEDLRRLLIVAPFVEADALARLADATRDQVQLIGRFDELAKLQPEELDVADSVDVFDDPAALLDVEDSTDPEPVQADAPNELSGLHAKVYVGERGRRAAVYVGSANATVGAFERNVELLVELEGSRAQHGIDAVRRGLEDGHLLRPFKPGAPIDEDERVATLERTLERAAHVLAAGALYATATAAGEGWRMALHWTEAVDVGGLKLEARPLSAAMFRSVDLRAEPCCTFAPTALSSVTRFFALRLTGRVEDVERHLEVTARLRLDGAPEGRCEAVTSELLSDRERLLRFILLLLADGTATDRALAELTDLLTEGRSGHTSASRRDSLGLPLLEPMLKALHRDPQRLEEIDRLLRDIRAVGAAADDLVPRELDELWEAIRAVRETVQ